VTAGAKSATSRSEWLQIVILTLLMTGGGFLILFLVLQLFLIPGLRSGVEAEQRGYKQLVELLDKRETKLARQRARQQKEIEGEAKTLASVTSEKLQAAGVELERRDPGRLPREVGGMTQETAKVSLKPATMRAILTYAVSVVDAKKSIKIDRLHLTRQKRGSRGGEAAENRWNAEIDFVEYTPKS
jgi:hypothetical protein